MLSFPSLQSFQPLLMALSLLSVFPVTGFLPNVWGAAQQGQSVLWYPFVGFLLGGLILLVAELGLSQQAPGIVALLFLVLWVGLTGALHLDGVADIADSFFALHKTTACSLEQQRQRASTICKQPTVGAMAVVALVLVLLSKFVLLSVLPLDFSLLLAFVLPRAFVVLMMLTTPYVSTGGMAAVMSQHLPRRGAYGMLAAMVAIVLLLLPPACAAILLGGLLLWFYYFRRLCLRLLGGYVGDCLGALIETAEVFSLLLLYGLWQASL